jgi:hypothetical protein
MSMESAVAALSTPVLKAVEAPPLQTEQVPPTQGTPQTLQEAVKPVKREVPGADRFAALAKKERALQQQAQALKAQQAKVAEYEEIRKQAATNPLKLLESLGLSYEQITQFMLNGQKPTAELEIQSVKQQLEQFKQEQVSREEAAKKAQEDQARAAYQQTLSDFSQEVTDFVKSNSETYELTSMYQGESIVQATIEQHFNQTKRIMSIKEASDLVEKYFEEQVAAAQKTKKFQAKQTPKEESQPKREQAAKQSTPTISNELTSSAPSLLPAKTEQDRLNRAMAALNQQG